MRADGCDKDDGVVWVAERAPCREVVCCATRRCGDANTIRLDCGEVLIIAEELNARHCRIWPSVYYHLVQDVVRAIWRVRVVILGFFTYQLLDQISALVVSLLRAHNSRFEAKAEVHGDALFESARQGKRIVVKVKLGKKSKRAKREGENRRDNTLEQP